MTTEIEVRARRATPTVNVGGVLIGSGHPVVVQSMTNTDTENVRTTAVQIAELARAGSGLVRITVNPENAAASVAGIMERLEMMSCNVPVVGDFQGSLRTDLFASFSGEIEIG
jgi:(E)-4-hydroxy-3-methylbut-2-enyl-diphosphate synthase